MHPGTGGDGIGPLYSNWDKDSISACNCHPGFFGPDCSLQMCAKGDDPLSLNQVPRKIVVEVGSDNGDASGTAYFTFLGFTTTFSVDKSQPSECTAAMEALKSVEQVSCTHANINNGFTWNVSFVKFPTVPVDNNIHSHFGNPSIDDFHCDVSQVTGTGAYCRINDVNTANVYEYDFCSGRGECDFDSGQCSCFDGFTGIDCSLSSYYTSIANNLPGAHIETFGADYQGTVMNLEARKSKATDFNMISAVSGEDTIFEVRGDGRVTVDTLYIAGEGLTVDDGGIYILQGGLTLEDSAFSTKHSNILDTVLSATSASATYGGIDSNGATVTPSVFTVLAADEASTTNYYYIRAGISQSTPYAFSADPDAKEKFSVRGDGYTRMANGLSVTGGGATVSDGGFSVTKGKLTFIKKIPR